VKCVEEDDREVRCSLVLEYDILEEEYDILEEENDILEEAHTVDTIALFTN